MLKKHEWLAAGIVQIFVRQRAPQLDTDAKQLNTDPGRDLAARAAIPGLRLFRDAFIGFAGRFLH